MSVDASQSGLGCLNQPISVALPIYDCKFLCAQRGEHTTIFCLEPPCLADECHQEAIAALESRGFPFGGALADRLGVGFVMIRKPGKLPYEKVGVDYALEYGTDRVEMHVGAVQPDQRVLLVDDLLATGGTAEASIKLLRDAAGADVVGCAFVIELAFLNGASRLAPTPIDALITY